LPQTLSEVLKPYSVQGEAILERSAPTDAGRHEGIEGSQLLKKNSKVYLEAGEGYDDHTFAVFRTSNGDRPPR